MLDIQNTQLEVGLQCEKRKMVLSIMPIGVNI